MSDSESELYLSMMRNIRNKRAKIELQSRSKYVLMTHLELSLKPAPHINFQLRTKTLLSCRTFSVVYRIISKISLRRKKSNLALSLKWNRTTSNSNITDKGTDGYKVVKQYVSDDLASGSEDNKRLRRATRIAVRVVRTGEKASCATGTTNDSRVFFLALIHSFSGKVDLFNRTTFTLCLFILPGFACNLPVSGAMFLPFITFWRSKISYARLHESELESKYNFRWFHSRMCAYCMTSLCERGCADRPSIIPFLVQWAPYLSSLYFRRGGIACCFLRLH